MVELLAGLVLLVVAPTIIIAVGMALFTLAGSLLFLVAIPFAALDMLKQWALKRIYSWL